MSHWVKHRLNIVAVALATILPSERPAMFTTTPHVAMTSFLHSRARWTPPCQGNFQGGRLRTITPRLCEKKRDRVNLCMQADAVGAADVQNASNYSKVGQQNVQTVLSNLQLRLPAQDMTFMCENFHVDHYGALVRPSPRMLQSLESSGYTVSAQFPSAIVSQILKSKYPKANITVTICKLQRGAEKLELFVVEGLTSSEFYVEAHALNHVAFSPNILEKHLVHRFKSIMQENGFLQGSAGINSTELCLYKGLTIQGITLVYFNRSPLNPGPIKGPANLEVCMAGMHPELLETA